MFNSEPHNVSEIADYFKREKYITRRLSVLVLAGTVVLVSIGLNVIRGGLPPIMLPWTVVGVVLAVAATVVLIVHRANVRFPRSSSSDSLPLNDETSRKLRRRILLLKAFVAIYAFILVSVLVHMHRKEWPGVLGAAIVIVIMEAALLKAIRRLTMKLQAGAILLRATQ